MDLERLDGVGCIEFDEDAATLEDAIMRDTVEAYNRRIKDFEEHQKARYIVGLKLGGKKCNLERHRTTTYLPQSLKSTFSKLF